MKPSDVALSLLFNPNTSLLSTYIPTPRTVSFQFPAADFSLTGATSISCYVWSVAGKIIGAGFQFRNCELFESICKTMLLYWTYTIKALKRETLSGTYIPFVLLASKTFFIIYHHWNPNNTVLLAHVIGNVRLTKFSLVEK